MLTDLKWDFLLIGVLIAGALGYGVMREPWLQKASEETAQGSRPPDRTEGDVLLLLPDAPAARAENFDELDCSYGWYNSLWQFYGSFATALNRNLSPEFLAGRNVVIVPRRVARAMPSTGISALTTFAREGGQVVLEQPGEGWEQMTGVTTGGKTRPAQQVTSVEGLGVRGRMRRNLPDVPLAGRLQAAPAMDPWPAGPTLMDVDGQPGLLVNELGDGKVYTFLFEFSCTVTALQQGLPERLMRFDRDDDPKLQPTAERVAHERMLTASAPYADLLEHAFFHRLSEVRPLPRLWPFPETRRGALMVTHPTPDDVRPTLGYLDYARKQKAHSTAFVAPDRISQAEAALVAKAGGEVGLLWVRGLSRPKATQTVGVGALRPYAHELSLEQQVAQLDAYLDSEEPPRMVHVERAHHLSDWASTFQQLAAAKLRVDTSFGPTAEDQHGYLFGTGFPFYPMDRQGLPLPVMEVPFVMHGANIDHDRLDDMLRASKNYFHQSLTVSLPGYAMRETPSSDLLLTYRDAFKMAEKHDHWVTSVGDLVDFLSARRRSVLTSQWNPDTRRLTVSVNLLGARVKSRKEGAYPGVAVPSQWDDHPIERITIDEEKYSLSKLATSGPGHEKILTLPPGRHTISVYYEKALEDGENGENGEKNGE